MTLPGWSWKVAMMAMLAAWLLTVGAHHEPWVDESQAWLIARDNGLFPLLIDRVRYEGTPGLWHLLLWLCIRCGLPFAGLYLVSVSCALAGAALLLWCAPFPAPLRALLACSYFGAYQYAIVARSYALDLVLLAALASLFPRRTRRPIAYGVFVGLLANSNAHSFFLAAALGGEWLLVLVRTHQLRVAWKGVAVATLLGLFALLIAWQPVDNNFLHPAFLPPHFVVGLRFVQEAFVDRFVFWSFRGPSAVEPLRGVALSVLLLIPSIMLFYRAGMLPLVAALSAILIGFSALTYANAWHSGLLFLVWIFCLWGAWSTLLSSPALRRAVIATMAIVGIVQATEAARAGLWDIHHPYSGAASAAQEIAHWRADHPHGRIAVAGFKAFAVQPYFPANIFANYHQGAARPSYLVWKRGEQWQPFATMAEARSAMGAHFGLLLISAYGMTPADLVGLEQMAAKHGYRAIGIYPGSLGWKGYAREDDTLIVLSASSRATEQQARITSFGAKTVRPPSSRNDVHRTSL